MSRKHIDYLRREHARLEAEIDREARQRRPDEVLIARLKKLKLAVKGQIAAWSSDSGGSRVA
ncbi:YdcH family protein [Sphingopyxis sp.]|uniref:YdcH family protein n=1 Tax=Sphingopyxis sp. TaxID=1908224 RepID=UPI002D79DC93|nr:YdcH family protein [Sphingopyxis sp.]HET6526841.1 YdcH family protein [Sphingopyxis sp.]